MRKGGLFFLLLLFLCTETNAQTEATAFGLYSNMGASHISNMGVIYLTKEWKGTIGFTGHLGADYTFFKADRFRVMVDGHFVNGVNRDWFSANAGFQVKTGSYPNYLGATIGYQFLENWGAEQGLIFGLVDTVFLPIPVEAILPFIQLNVSIDLANELTIGLTTGIRLNAHKINKQGK